MDFGRQMRAPSFLGLRDHKEPKDVTTRPEALNSPGGFFVLAVLKHSREIVDVRRSFPELIRYEGLKAVDSIAVGGILYGEGIVAGCEHRLDELRRVRSCTLASQR